MIRKFLTIFSFIGKIYDTALLKDVDQIFSVRCNDTDEECWALAIEKSQEMLRQKYVPSGIPNIISRLSAAVALIFAAPLMFIIAVMIRLDSPGPAIFRQVRIGKDRRWNRNRRNANGQCPDEEKRKQIGDRRKVDYLGPLFVMYKFRTMYRDSAERFPELFDFDGHDKNISNLYLAMQEDPRVTRIGRFLRRTSLDELPNLINVVLGHMVLVGPRPEITAVAKYYNHWEKLKFKVKPGLTGKAQISGRGFLSFHETNLKDVQYVIGKSWWNDVKIIFKTVISVFRGSGAF